MLLLLLFLPFSLRFPRDQPPLPREDRRAKITMVRLTSMLALVSSLVGETMASGCQTNTGLTQMITYVKRHPSYTREEFWEYWETEHAPKVVPLSTHFNITRYQQVCTITSPFPRVLPIDSNSPDPSWRQDPPHRSRR